MASTSKSGAPATGRCCNGSCRSAAPAVAQSMSSPPERPCSSRCSASSCCRVGGSPPIGERMPQARRPHGEWVGISINVISAAYNTNLVRPDEVPKRYDDLKDPRWKGRLAIDGDDVDWFAAVVDKLGEETGLRLFADIVPTTGVSVRPGHTLIANMVAVGE